MKSKQQTIEMNGKVYDAHSGHFLRHSTDPGHHINHHAHKKTRHPHSKSNPPHSPKVHSKQQKAKTLMRHAVKKPRKSNPPLSSTVSHNPRRILDVDPAKLHRAKQIKKSHQVSKFSNGTTVVRTTATILPVRPEPVDSPPPAASFHHAPSASSFDIKPPSKADFENAIHYASAHSLPHKKKTSKRAHLAHRINVSTRIINITAVGIGLLIMVGTFAWQNVPDMSIKLASAKAGVEATLPSYTPAGFSLEGPIVYEQGQITLNYTSNSDERSYQIIQVDSGMDNHTLRENYLSQLNYGYTPLPGENRTVYLYDDYKATWLSGGVWYRVGGDFPFSSEQIFKLADSL